MDHGNKGDKKAAADHAAEPDDCLRRLAAVKMSPLKPLPAVVVVPDEITGKHPVFQELAAMEQEIRDVFSGGQLALTGISARLESDLAAISGKPPAAAPPPVPRETGPEPRAEERTSPVEHIAQQAIPEKASAEKPAPADTVKAPARGRAVLFSVLALCAAVFSLVRFYAVNKAVISFPLPSPHTAGLCLDPSGGRVFFSDPQRQLLFEVSAADGQVRSVKSFPAAGLKGLAFDGVSFWSSDGTAVYRHTAAGGYAALDAYPVAGASLICWRDGELWVAAAPGELRRYSAGKTLLENGAHQMPPGDTAGISVAGGVLWLFNPATGELSGYTLAAKPELKLERTVDLKPLLPGKGTVSGFALGGNYIWLVMENPAELVRINLKHVKLSGAGG